MKQLYFCPSCGTVKMAEKPYICAYFMSNWGGSPVVSHHPQATAQLVPVTNVVKDEKDNAKIV